MLLAKRVERVRAVNPNSMRQRVLTFLAEEGGRWTPFGVAEALSLDPALVSSYMRSEAMTGRRLREVDRIPSSKGGRSVVVYEVVEEAQS